MIKGIMGIQGTQKANVIWRSFFFLIQASLQILRLPTIMPVYSFVLKKKNLVKHYGSQQFANIIDNKLC